MPKLWSPTVPADDPSAEASHGSSDHIVSVSNDDDTRDAPQEPKSDAPTQFEAVTRNGFTYHYYNNGNRLWQPPTIPAQPPAQLPHDGHEFIDPRLSRPPRIQDWEPDKETLGSDFAIRAYGFHEDPAIDAEDQRPEGSPSSFPHGETTEHDLLDQEIEDRTASMPFICVFCSTCPKEFATKLELRHHLVTHNPGSRQNPCKYENCNLAFRFPKDLRRHERIVHSEPNRITFVCPEAGCTAEYNRKDNLARHRRNKHAGTDVSTSTSSIPDDTSVFDDSIDPLRMTDWADSARSGIVGIANSLTVTSDPWPPTGSSSGSGSFVSDTHPLSLASDHADSSQIGSPLTERDSISKVSVKSTSTSYTRSRSSSTHSSASSTLSRASLAFSQCSMASSATSLGTVSSVAQYSGLINDMTKALFCTKQLEPILAVAFKDPDIGAKRLETNARRMIQHLGKDLKAEVQDKIQLDTSRALKTPRLSSHAARLVLEHMDVMTTKPAVEEPTRIDSDLGDDSSDALDEDDEKELSSTQYQEIHDFLFNSKAYDTFKADLLDFMHKPYERRVTLAISGGLVGPQGGFMDQDAINLVAREVSWVPTRLITFSHDVGLSCSDGIKAFVEQHMGETWNWWPLAPRLHRLRPGYFRLGWVSPCGILRHADLPLSAKSAVQQAVSTAPAFIDIDFPKHIRSHTSTGSGNIQSVHYASPSSQSGSSGVTSSTTLPLACSKPQQVSMPTPVATPGHHNTMQSSQQLQHDQHLSLCVVSSSRQFISLRCDNLRSDLQFFATMKAAYTKARGWPRVWLSMWQYRCCEFVLFHKYGYRRGARVDIGFPSANDQMYHFLPRKPTPPPPNGPISREQFQDHYYLDHCPSLYDWRRYQLSHRGHFNKVNRVALDAVPKRLVPIDMDDGVDEQFFGLYAKEERSFFRVAIYACLCNLPGVIFFFLWVFQWGHGSDLQNASVPLTLSLSLTLGFVAVVFGTRDRT